MKHKNILFVALLFIAGPLTLMLFNQGKKAQSQPTTATAPTSVTSTTPSTITPAKTKANETKAPRDISPAKSVKTRWPVTKTPVREVVLGSNDKADGFKIQVRLTSLGAAVKTAKLTDFFATVADKRRCKREKNHAAYLQTVEKDPELKGHYKLLKSVSAGGREFYPLATRRITITASGERISLDLSGSRWLAGEVQTEKDKEGKTQSQSVTFSARIDRNDEEFLLLKKKYTLRTGSYSILVDLEAVNLNKADKVEFSLMQFSATGLSKEDARSDNRTLAYGVLDEGKVKTESLSSRDIGKMEVGLANTRSLGRSDSSEPVLWTGQTNKFFAALTYIIPEDSGKLAAPEAQAAFFGSALEETEQQRTSLAGMKLGPYELAGGASTDVRLDLFAGPKKRDLFDDTPLYRNLGYKGTLQTGACFCAFQPLTLGMMWLLDFFRGSVTLGNYGVAIILLVVLVRICLHPLMKKQQVSMMRMQKLAPEMEKVKKKYANDKAKLNAEMMKLYKTQGATPLLGCLPMFLQMPILIALWTSINASVELRHAAFLPVWIIDLAAPDALIPFGGGGFSIPLVGSMIGPITGFNLLPLLLCVVMYLQMKMNPSMSASTSPQQASSQTMMKYMMPGMMLVFFYNAPSGLNLYFMTSTFAGLVEQYVIRKHIREKEAAEAAAVTTVAMPGKRFRGQKPKKPKGPFQIKR
ncbi:MAG: YidC/Oxa1 family insertase periplasmic-domain containing protein [Planctomycetota bacterium]|nr:YidC/Oxa1 family insertase periplasmic-domain containing protein [Planctomycetota bacterium]